MARKIRKLAEFDELANDNKNIDENVNDDVNVDITNQQLNGTLEEDPLKSHPDEKSLDENVEEPDTLDKILKSPKGKKVSDGYDKIVVGFHVEKDLASILDKLQKQGGKGTKSQIINDLLRKRFKEVGLL